MKRRRGHFRGVKFLEQRLQRNDLAGRNSVSEHGAQLLKDGFIAVMRTALGTKESHRRESSARQLSQ